ncbi:hypothetical protein BCR34DRAFT_649615 [Clohesyomyces aquaticus]|uniref:Uncharacterized protein n=1 Tax=Clohesyomyces aquaticus TaxID=1231657 RepID=A0A1Y1ZTP4_9PLEO|nr:hypothetical protein BCR34DRAFT_649615 [Clohesyomyces aquaticus]
MWKKSKSEIANMIHMYKSSTVTIIAASSSDVSRGFLQPPSTLSFEVPFRINGGAFSSFSLVREEDLEHWDRYEPINTRRRTLQEHPDEALSHWLAIVHIYSRRTLSFHNDKLPALAGIAQEYLQHLGPGYYVRMWEYRLPFQLLWRYSQFYPSSCPSQYLAPSRANLNNGHPGGQITR